MKKILSVILCFVLAVSFSVCACAGSGEASGGTALPASLAELPTVQAEPWVKVSDDRVGLEGPAFDANGDLYVCSTGMTYPINYILKIDAQKNISTVYEGPLSPLGLAFDGDGRLYAVCREGELLIMDSDGGHLESVTPSYDGKTFSLNDLAFTAAGDLLVTDWQGSVANPIGGIYLLTKESGYQQALVLADQLAGPNGISLSPDGNTLWVGMTNEQAVYRIALRYENDRPEAESVEKIYDNPGSGQPDSNKTDTDGNLYQAIIQAGRILVFSEDAEPIANIVIPESSLRMTSNLAIKPGTSEGYMLTAGFGQGSWIYTFESLAPAASSGGEASDEPSGESSGEASGESTPIAAAIEISAEGVTADPAYVSADVSGGEAQGLLIESDELYLRGISITAGALAVGGEKGYYDIETDENGIPHAVEGSDWNSVILLNDPEHESDRLYGDGARENSLGSGIYTTGADSFLTLDHAYVWTSGAVRSALAVNGLSTVVVRDSYLESTGAVTCYKPVTRLLLSTCRSNVIVGGNAYYYNSTSISNDWGALSTDTGGPNPTYLYAYNVTTDNLTGGYTTYADTNCRVEIYGSDMRSAEYGGFIACSGILRIGSLAEATDEALAYAEADDLLAEDKPSVITAGRNDVVVHLVDSMGRNSGYDRMAGVLDISNTTLKTDRTELTPRDYYNDENGEAYGESGYFLDYTAGSAIVLRSTNVAMTLRNVTFDNYENSATGRPIAIHSVLNYDARGAVSVPDGEASLHHEIDIADSAVDGDIVHMDYQRAMNLRLENTTLNGAVVSGTTAAWNSLWRDVQDNGKAENFDAEKIYSLLTKNEAYDTVWGVHLSLDGHSVWNVTGTSTLASLTLAEGAVLAVPDGYTIYVDADMDNADLTYDASTGRAVSELEAGVTYHGVVIEADAATAFGPGGASGDGKGDTPPDGFGGGSLGDPM